MITEEKDKTYSTIFLILSCLIVLYGFGSANNVNPIPNGSVIDYLYFLVKSYFDFIMIGYVFICLQIAGYYELKYKQDYFTLSLLIISLTPFSLLFIKFNNSKND
jgi:hypothetical protein